MALTVSLLGSPRVERDGRPVSFDTRKAVALLAYLALDDRPHSRDALAEFLWPGHDNEHARGALRRTLSTLRRAIGGQHLDATRDRIALTRGPELEIDVDRFRSLTAEGASEAALEQAAELFNGDLLDGFSPRGSPAFDDWQIGEASALERELASALRRLVELLVARGDFEQAVPRAQRWLELDPLHEPAHRELIRLYAWSGDRAAAPRAAKPGAPPELPLVGREDELTALLAAHAAAQPDGGLAVIEGEAGIGKTRLASELANQARSRGAVVLSARCHDDEAGLPYGPVVELLREAVEVAESGDWPDV